MIPLYRRFPACLAAPVFALATALGTARAATPQDLLADYVARSPAPADAARGRTFFTSPHGRDWACASCHGSSHKPSPARAAT